MSNTRKQQPEKISADCPHCGYSQLESALAKSTVCRRCSQYFSIEKLLAKEVASLKAPGMLERLSRFMHRDTPREIKCFSCGATQVVSSIAESSSCPKCGSYIDLRDFRISGPFGRTVQTQGKVTILPKGEVTTRILCGSGRIEGKMRGTMVCTGTLEVKLDGRLAGQLDAEHLLVEKRANVEAMKPVVARALEINGTLIAPEIRCDKVTVNKHGVLKGSVYARAVAVEKGGILEGELHIGPPETQAPAVEPAPPEDGPKQAELLPDPPQVRQSLIAAKKRPAGRGKTGRVA